MIRMLALMMLMVLSESIICKTPREKTARRYPPRLREISTIDCPAKFFATYFAMAVGGLWWLMSATKTGLVPHDVSESLSRFNLFPTISVFGEPGEGIVQEKQLLP